MNKAQKGEARAAARRWLRRARSERPKNLAALLFTLTLLASMFACAAADQQPALTIVESGLPAGTTQSSYQATLVAVGGLPPYAWKVQKGQLPNGLTLDSKSGIISGMPSKAGQWSVVVAVTDHFQPYPETDTANFGFNISSDNTTQPTNPAQSDPLSISSSTLPNGEVSQSYAQTVSATGGTSPYAWSVSSGKLPPGLSLSASGGISGTATTAGSYPFTL
ncbi:MAG: Ig domain-containing protein, partial [Candidatus Acidiferrales bacterium]